MKSVFAILAVIFVSTLAQAKPVELKCRSIEGKSMLENLTLTMEPADTENGSVAPGYLRSQKIVVKYVDGSELTTKTVSMKQLGGDNILKGSFELGYDFGSANLLLVDDYDNSEIVAVVQVSTDGPITVETHRCK